MVHYCDTHCPNQWKYKVGDTARALRGAWPACREGVNMSHVFT